MLLGLVTVLPACGKSKESLEAERVLHAIDVLREAPGGSPAERMALVVSLEQAPAEAIGAITARDTCAKAYRSLEEGTALEARARAAFTEPGTAPAALLSDVVAAEAKVNESKAAMPACEAAQADLRRHTR